MGADEAGGVELGGESVGAAAAVGPAVAAANMNMAINKTNNVPATVLAGMETILTVIAAPSGSQAQ